MPLHNNGMGALKIQTIQKRIRAGNYVAKPHAVQHALKEGFKRIHILDAILNGKIIEKYPDEERVLISGMTTIQEGTLVYLHVVCEHAHPVLVEFITAYIPDELQWEPPTFENRRRKNR